MSRAAQSRVASPPGRLVLLAALGALVLIGCARPGASRPTPPELERPRIWQFQTSEHVALWYFGLAHSGTPIAERRTGVLPLHDSLYVRRATDEKRARGIAPTPLERHAAELRTSFGRNRSLEDLEFLPLHFHDQHALVTAVRVWRQVGGDPRRAGSQQAANVVALLSGMFPLPSHRDILATFTDALVEEHRLFFAAHWAQRRPLLQRVAELAGVQWSAYAAALRPLLSYLNLEGGDVFLVPTLGAEGRMVARGAGRPRAAVRAELPARWSDGTSGAAGGETPAVARTTVDAVAATMAEAAVFGLLCELLHALAADAVREHVAPARMRELGSTMLERHAAVRGGALVLAAVAPARLDAYRLHFLLAAGQRPPATAALQRTFEATFALPPELERGLDEAVRTALAGI